MLSEIFTITCAFSTFMAGIVMLAVFLDMWTGVKEKAVFILYCVAEIVINFFEYKFFGYYVVQAYYPLIVHFPMLILLLFVYKKRLFPSLIAITMVYLCCQLSNWLAMLTYLIPDGGAPWLNDALHTLFAWVCGIVIARHFGGQIRTLLSGDNYSLALLCIVPFFYYLFDYAFTVYTEYLYAGSPIVVEGIMFLLCLAFLFFCIETFHQIDSKQKSDARADFLEMKQRQSEHEVEAMKRSEAQVSRLRHDMRHFIAEVSMMIKTESYEQAQNYLKTLTETLDDTAPKRYSANETINMIVSSFEGRLIENAVELRPDLEVGNHIAISDVDLTSILSNALENALHGVAGLPGDKWIELKIRESNNRLLITVNNPCSDGVRLVDGIPYTDEKGHGIGTRSIVYTTEKIGGNCQFTVKDGTFSLKIVV